MSTPPVVPITIPARFYDDHSERDLPTPVALNRSGTKVTIDLNDPATPELLADALHYADRDGPTAGDPSYRGLRWSATVTAQALEEAGVKVSSPS